MSTTDVNGDSTTDTAKETTVAMRLEAAVIPVADVDRARAFYEGLGWHVDADLQIDDHARVVQITPPGSPASILFGKGTTTMTPGTVEDMVLVVDDVDVARAQLISRGVDVTEVWHDVTGIYHHAGSEGRVSGRDPEGRPRRSWASFRDPDGNGWQLQEIPEPVQG